MKPSAALELKRIAVREATKRFRTTNPRIFGSVLHGTYADGSVLIFWWACCQVRPCLTLVVCKSNWKTCSASASIYVLQLICRLRDQVLAEARPV